MQDKAETRRMYQPRPPAEGSDRDALRNAIVQEEALLAVLEVQQEESRHRLAALRAELVLEQGRSPILLTETRTISSTSLRSYRESHGTSWCSREV